MSRRRCRRHRQDTFASIVDDSAHFASRCGPAGALATGLTAFVVFYAVLPMCVMAWIDSNKAKLAGPAASAFAQALDHVASHRFVEPSQWVGIASLLVCTTIALWKHLEQAELSYEEVSLISTVARFVSSLLGRSP